MPRIFISYGHDVFRTFVSELAEFLAQNGHDVFKDDERRKGGLDGEHFLCIAPASFYDLEIDRAIQECDMFISVLSHHSTRPNGVCLDEIARAREFCKKILPLKIENVSVPLLICRIQWIELFLDYNEKDGYSYNAEDRRRVFDEILAIANGQAVIHDTGMSVLERQLVTESFDFSKIIGEKTRHFVGRGSLFSQVEDWAGNKDDSRILLLSGSAGTGKTSFCARSAYIIHICSFDHTASVDARNVLGSLAYQLSLQIKDYAEYLSSMHELARLRSKSVSQIFEIMFISTLTRIPEPEYPVVVIVDAVDEMEPDQRNELLYAVSSLQSGLPNWFKMILTTRPDSGVAAYFPYAKIVDLDRNDEENRTDCRTYLKARLDALGVGYTTQAVDTAVDNSDGNFLYIYYLLEDIVGRAEEVLDVNDLPKNIGIFYLNWLHRVFGGDITEYRRGMLPLLQLLCAVKSPVTFEEVSQILGDAGSSIMGSIRKTRSMIKRNADGTISFYHKAVKDWLCDLQASEGYYVDSDEGARRIVDFIREEYEMTGMLPELEYIKKYGGVHLIDRYEAELFYQIYSENEGEQRDDLCRAFVQVSTKTLTRFLLILKKKTNSVDFWSFLNNVVSVCNDLGEYQKTIDICRSLFRVADRNLKILLHSILCIRLRMLNEHAKALEEADKMLVLLQEIGEDGSPEERYVCAAAHNVAGYACGFCDRIEQAQLHHEKSIELAQPLLESSHENLRSMAAQQVYYGYSNLSFLMVDINTERSAQYSRLELEAARRLGASSQEYRNQLNELNAYSSLVDCALREYRFSEAIELCQEAIPHAEALVKRYPSVAANRTLAVLYSLVGKAELRQSGDTEKCLDYFQKGLLLIKENKKMLPSEQANRDLALGYTKIGQLNLERGAIDAAINDIEKAIDVYEHLVKLFPSRRHSHDLASGYILYARAHLKQGAVTLATEQIRAALEILDAMAFPNTQVCKDICWCHQLLGDISTDQDKTADAFYHYTRYREMALELVKKDPGVSSIFYVVFSDLKLAFLEKDRANIGEGIGYVSHALRVFLGNYGLRAEEQILVDVADRILSEQNADILRVYAVMKDVFGARLGSLGEKDIQLLENAVRSFAANAETN